MFLKRLFFFVLLTTSLVGAERLQYQLQKDPSFLHTTIHSKATVGTVVLRTHAKEWYVLLGQERENPQKPEKSLMYADLGGNGDKGKTFLPEMLRELWEESVGLINPEAEDFLKRSIFLRADTKKRIVIYALYTPDSSHIVDAAHLNQMLATATLTQKKQFPERYEKANYIWAKLSDVRKAKPGIPLAVQLLDGSKTTITVRTYLIEAVLHNPFLDEGLSLLS